MSFSDSGNQADPMLVKYVGLGSDHLSLKFAYDMPHTTVLDRLIRKSLAHSIFITSLIALVMTTVLHYLGDDQ